MSQTYPFASRKEVLHRVAGDPEFAMEAVRMIDARHAWMASHRTRAAKLIAKLDAGSPTPADHKEASALAGRYSRTLARILRESALAERPELAAIGAVFGVVAAPVSLGTTPETPAVALPSPPETATAPEAPTPPRRRGGRPKGSKNKPKAAVEAGRRKRG